MWRSGRKRKKRKRKQRETHLVRKITEPEQANPCYVEESAIASTSQQDQFSETVKTVFKNYEIGPSNPNRLLAVVTVDQEEYKWSRQP
jgi:hypothetical protein